LTGYLEEYFPLAVFFGLSLGFGLVLMVAPLLAAVSNPDAEKIQLMSVGLSLLKAQTKIRYNVLLGCYIICILI